MLFLRFLQRLFNQLVFSERNRASKPRRSEPTVIRTFLPPPPGVIHRKARLLEANRDILWVDGRFYAVKYNRRSKKEGRSTLLLLYVGRVKHPGPFVGEIDAEARLGHISFPLETILPVFSLKNANLLATHDRRTAGG